MNHARREYADNRRRDCDEENEPTASCLNACVQLLEEMTETARAFPFERIA